MPDRVNWSDDMNIEYCYLRECLCSSPCPCIPLPCDLFCLQTDASGVGIGAVLSVVCGMVEHPVAFYSPKLSPAETNYSATEFEGLAVVAVIQHFSVYRYGVHFTVETDYRALSFLQSAKHLNGHLARWALQLQNFNFTMYSIVS